jgi:hypothetical protein
MATLTSSDISDILRYDLKGRFKHRQYFDQNENVGFVIQSIVWPITNIMFDYLIYRDLTWELYEIT